MMDPLPCTFIVLFESGDPGWELIGEAGIVDPRCVLENLPLPRKVLLLTRLYRGAPRPFTY